MEEENQNVSNGGSDNNEEYEENEEDYAERVKRINELLVVDKPINLEFIYPV